MAKLIKQMEMDDLKKTFQDVRDMVFLSHSRINAQTENEIRLSLRKKNVRLKMVKNSLARRVFNELGLKVENYWGGPTVIAWGTESLAELSREIESFTKKNNNLQVKGALVDGQEISFDRALTMPTRAEAIARVVQLALSPASRIASLVRAPGARLASQIKSIADRGE
ncbi:MAG: 50S ribosomal protein L10 [Gemmatales bacterium]|nr:MAG: 50S ribosomal protein L10 [Gemmatales bacterium]